MTNKVYVTKTPDDVHDCEVCGKALFPTTLTVVLNPFIHIDSALHLTCFDPPRLMPIIYSRDVQIMDDLSPQEIGTVKQWCDQWNQQFTISEETIKRKFCTSKVVAKPPPNYRVLFEICTFLTATDLDARVGLTCKAWFSVTRDEHLWRQKCEIEFLLKEKCANYRVAFILRYKGHCWCCRKPAKLDHLAMICPLRNRPLCLVCSNLQECLIMNMDWFFERKHVDPSLSAKLHFPTFRQKGVEKAYARDLSGLMSPYAESRREILLSLIDSSPSKVTRENIDFIRDFNFENFYDSFQIYRKNVIIAMVTFCGRSDHNENMEESYQAFLKDL